MAVYLPPGFPFIPPPPPPRSLWSPPPPPTRHGQFSPAPRDNNATSPGGVIAGVVISVGAFLLVLSFVCSLCQGYRNSRANAAAAAALAARPQAPPQPQYWDNDEHWLRRHRSDDLVDDGDGPTRRARPTAGLPSFTYNRAVRHNVTGGGDEAATTCSVCLGAFQAGETVRLLPVCLHLYHVECIDPWLEAHSTCPLCRSGTEDPTMHGDLLPPV